MIVPDTLHVSDYLDLMCSLPEARVDLILTDVPYNTTNLHFEFALDFAAWWTEVGRVLKPSGVVVMTASQPFTTDLISSNRQWYRYNWVWVKNVATGFLSANRKPLKCHEDICVFSPIGAVYHPQMREGKAYRATPRGVTTHYNQTTPRTPTINTGTRYPQTILEFPVDRHSSSTGTAGLHPSQKPLALFDYLIRTHSNAGDLVLDPFVGSGTTALAAKTTGRHYIGGDISAEYIAIAQQRLNPTFGDPPKRERDSAALTDLPMFRDLLVDDTGQ